MSHTFKLIEGQKTYTSDLAFVLFELDRLHFPTPWSLDSWNNLFLDHDRLLVLIKNEEEVIGFCLFDKVVADSFAHLLKIVIHPEFRSKGLSKELLSESLLNLQNCGCSQFFLEVEESNLAAQKLYLSLGFKMIHRKKDFYGQNRSALIMTRS